MNKNTRNHIRSLLWEYKKNKKEIKELANVIFDPCINYSAFQMENSDSINYKQLIFKQMFIKIVDNILADSSYEINDIFISKYLLGYPSKNNEVVSYEVSISESTVKRRDNEFIREIALNLGWQ